MADDLEVIQLEEAPSNPCGCEYGDGQFCGIDGQCHIYSCQAWYEFAPRNWTGYDAESPLVCTDLTAPTEPGVIHESVAYRCNSLTPEPIRMGFTKKCTVAGTNHDFTCYGLAKNTDFQPFLDEAAASQMICTEDETDYPKFSYEVVTESQQPGMGYVTRQQGFDSTAEFNETIALVGTMHARYEMWTDQPTRSPTMRPTTFPTLATGNAAASSLISSSETALLSIVVSWMVLRVFSWSMF